MAASSTFTYTELGSKYVVDRNCVGSQASVNVTGSTGVIYLVEVDNQANSHTVYLKIRDATTATPITTTANGAGTPDYSFMVPAFTQTCFTMPSGVAFTTGLSMWCTTSAAVGTTTSPTNPVIVKLITT